MLIPILMEELQKSRGVSTHPKNEVKVVRRFLDEMARVAEGDRYCIIKICAQREFIGDSSETLTGGGD
jgi:uncharacterized protein (UPF0216 family)